eukprot:6212868-Pleurochrysis_carterae.AAC.3
MRSFVWNRSSKRCLHAASRVAGRASDNCTALGSTSRSVSSYVFVPAASVLTSASYAQSDKTKVRRSRTTMRDALSTRYADAACVDDGIGRSGDRRAREEVQPPILQHVQLDGRVYVLEVADHRPAAARRRPLPVRLQRAYECLEKRLGDGRVEPAHRGRRRPRAPTQAHANG